MIERFRPRRRSGNEFYSTADEASVFNRPVHFRVCNC